MQPLCRLLHQHQRRLLLVLVLRLALQPRAVLRHLLLREGGCVEEHDGEQLHVPREVLVVRVPVLRDLEALGKLWCRVIEGCEQPEDSPSGGEAGLRGMLARKALVG